MKVCVSNSKEELRNTTVEELKRKLIPEDQRDDAVLCYKDVELKDDHTLGFYHIKPKHEIIAVYRGRGTSIREKYKKGSSHVFKSTVSVTESFSFEDDDDGDDEDEDKQMPRTQSLEHLALMKQPDRPVM